MTKPSTRARLLEAGRELIHRQGFAPSGVAEITATAGVPKGSFYNHFESKEAFALAVLEAYWAAAADTFAILAGPGPVPTRVTRHFAALRSPLAEHGFAQGCLIGNLATEAAPGSTVLRARVAELFAAWTGALAAALRAGQADGSVGQAVPADTLARFLVAAWEGAVQRAKAERDGRSLDAFDVALERLLAP